MDESRVEVVVDRDRCKGVRMCMYDAPGAFIPDAEGLSMFVPDGIWTLEQLREAVEDCPNETLTLIVDGVVTGP